ncbi:hypothetical protein P3342_004360 [Pyrenophora teres f. teres]|nr:hypothetical protein P3342_004360 [Pyrenophora teres f. teres]
MLPWIDFAERRLDRQSLLQQLHGLSTSPTIAVSNIPYSKTMVSRCLVRSLDGAEGETSDSPDWLASVHQQTQDCRSLSAAELVELAQEAECRVEISWSRQHSQQGGLDAIFHRYQPLTGERVMFRFPTDHAERPLHSLSSKPLRQQFLQKTQQRLVEMLEAQLPTYMVPQTLTVLDAMPVNPNGKVDRKALEQQADTQSNHSGQKQQPSTPAERAMQQLWAGVLAIAPDSIGLDDSFFRLGGDSIAAMKLVGEARRAGIQLTVADLFRNPRLDQLTAAATASTHASPVSIPQVEHVGPVAQSFAQGRLWFLEELHPGLTWYLMPLAVRIRGPLDLPALHSALLAVERRHDAADDLRHCRRRQCAGRPTVPSQRPQHHRHCPWRRARPDGSSTSGPLHSLRPPHPAWLESDSLPSGRTRPRAVDCHAPHHLRRLVGRRADA